MKILSIGDVHGADIWMYATHNSPQEFSKWIKSGKKDSADLPFMKFDKIIFVGDYVDSFRIPGVRIFNNLKNIVAFKERYPDKIVLLFGNHDVSYFTRERCSGYRAEMRADLEKFFNSKMHLFQLAYEVKTANEWNYLWTHAGVSNEWYKEFLIELTTHYRFGDLTKDQELNSIADHLNLGWQYKLDSIFKVDSYSGGYSRWAGPLWVRPGILNKNPLKKYVQINGHTRVRNFERHVLEDAVHYLIDCNENLVDDNHDITFQGFKLDIDAWSSSKVYK